MIYFATFIFDELPHITIGEEHTSMPVYYQPAGSRKYVRRQVKFPAWLKFVDEDEFTEVTEGQGESVEEILQQLQSELDEGTAKPS